jgi:hypothetical protein
MGECSPSSKELSMQLERFLNRQNIERYRRLLDVVCDETQRRQILGLLEEEEEKTRELQRGELRLSQNGGAERKSA